VPSSEFGGAAGAWANATLAETSMPLALAARLLSNLPLDLMFSPRIDGSMSALTLVYQR
jgi:hypothetical protein